MIMIAIHIFDLNDKFPLYKNEKDTEAKTT